MEASQPQFFVMHSRKTWHFSWNFRVKSWFDVWCWKMKDRLRSAHTHSIAAPLNLLVLSPNEKNVLERIKQSFCNLVSWFAWLMLNGLENTRSFLAKLHKKSLESSQAQYKVTFFLVCSPVYFEEVRMLSCVMFGEDFTIGPLTIHIIDHIFTTTGPFQLILI